MIWSGSTVNSHQRSHNHSETAKDGKKRLPENTPEIKWILWSLGVSIDSMYNINLVESLSGSQVEK